MKPASVFLWLFLMEPLSVGSLPLVLPLDCSEVYEQNHNRSSGVYTIFPVGVTSAIQVYCDMSSDGGQWTVFQRRLDGSVNFYRPWELYRLGFGTAAGEYWLGLENLFYLTLRKKYQLLVDMEDFSGRKAFARYASFSVDSESEGYRLNVSGFSDGGAGDALTYHSGQKFSTFDKDQDSWPNNCAKSFMGGFWYKYCHSANLNGAYRWGADGTFFAVGVEWLQWTGEHGYSLKATSMKIRPVQ